MNEEFRLLQQAAEQLNWAEEKRQLEELEQQEQERNFFVAFVGRYSAGKSCLINNLLGRELLPHGTTETTTALTYLRFGEEEKALIHTVDGGVQQVTLEQVRDVDQRKELWEPDTLEYLEVFVNSDLLRGGMILLDTPGINTVIQRHEQLLARSLAFAGRTAGKGRGLLVQCCQHGEELSMGTPEELHSDGAGSRQYQSERGTEQEKVGVGKAHPDHSKQG